MKTPLCIVCFLAFLSPFFSVHVRAQATDLFISEYSESNSTFNNWIELYNGTGASIDLSDYRLVRHQGGGTGGGTLRTLSLSGTLADGSTYLITPSSNSNTTVTSAADMLVPNGLSVFMLLFNGADAVVLQKDIASTWTNIDVIGGVNAGPYTVGSTANGTQDNVLVRKSTVCGPDTAWSTTVFDQWDILALNTTDSIGAHTACVVAATCISFSGTWSNGSGLSGSTSGDDVCITSGTATISASGACANLEVDASAVLSLDSGVVLTVSGDITNNGTISVAAGANLYQTVSTDNNSGSGTYNISSETGSVQNNRAYNYWSSPLADESLEDVFSASNTSDFYSYNNLPWASASGTMTPGRGYAATNDIAASYPVVFTQTFSGSNLNNGSIALSGLGTDYADWVLIGNPYPSPLSLDSLDDDNANLSSSFWFWNHQTSSETPDSTQDYATYVVGVGGTGAASASSFIPDGTVAVGQGFMAQLTSGSSISFENTQRSGTTQMDFFKSRSQPADRHLIWLGLLSGDHSNQLLIGFVPDGEKTVGPRDGKKLKGSQSLAFYSLAEQEELAIQGLPKLPLNATEKIPLGVDIWNPDACTIRVDSLYNLPAQYQLLLEDKQQGTRTDLRTQPWYAFHAVQTGIDHQRFALVVKNGLSTSDTETPHSLPDSLTTSIQEEGISTSFRTYQIQEELHAVVQGPNDPKLTSIRVYDMQGRILFEADRIFHERISIPVSSFSPGIYHVVTTTQRGKAFTSKTFIR